MSSLKKGTLYLSIGWGFQILAGYILNTWLGRNLGLVEYGSYGIVMSILVWFEVGAISGIPTAIQKFTAAEEKNALQILRTSCLMQGVFVFFLFVISFVLSPSIGKFLKDSNLGGYLRIAIWDIWIYSFFFVLMSLQNGLHKFGRHALLITIYSVSKVVGAIILVTWLDSVNGAFLANIFGSLAGLLLGIYFLVKSDLGKQKGTYNWKSLYSFAAPVAAFSLAVNLFLSIDLWTVTYFLDETIPGHYTAASTLARVPYYIFFGLSATVLPGLSRALSKNQELTASETVRSAVRFLILLVLPICLLSITYGKEALMVLFGPEFGIGGEIFRSLIWGLSLLALFFLFTTVLNADNRPKLSLQITLGSVVLDGLINILLVPRIGVTGAPFATIVSLSAACGVAGFFVYKRFGTIMRFGTLLRILTAASAVFIVSLFIPAKGVFSIVMMIALYVGYGIMLLILKEINRKEILDLIPSINN